MNADQDAEITFEVAVLRCRCGDPQTHIGQVCSQAERVVTETQRTVGPFHILQRSRS